MPFRSVFIAVVIGFSLLAGAFLINSKRPPAETDQPSAAFVRAGGKCAECHSQQQYSVVHEYQMSAHARQGVNCLKCHAPAEISTGRRNGFRVISSAFAVGFLVVPFVIQVTYRYLMVCASVLLLQAAVGVAGFMLHAAANLRGPSTNIFQNLINGAPPLAPLLFPNLVMLALIGLWVLSAQIRKSRPAAR